MSCPPVLAFTQGDPAGIGPEILLKLVMPRSRGEAAYVPLLIAERAALEPLAERLGLRSRRRYLARLPSRAELEGSAGEGRVAVWDPQPGPRSVRPGEPEAEDGRGALAALDAGLELARSGEVDALVTAPLGKSVIARHLDPEFRGHTDYLARRCGLERYGRDYLMSFLTDDLKVALLSTHLPLREAVEQVSEDRLVEALTCLQRTLGRRAGRIAVAGLNPHAGEGSLLGREDAEIVAPAVARARIAGLEVCGPLSPDTVFSRARRGEFDWVLALYHDQGLIAVKSAAFGRSTHLTLGLPFLRTSVDHGTAYELAGRGLAEVAPLRYVVATTLRLIAERQRSA